MGPGIVVAVNHKVLKMTVSVPIPRLMWLLRASVLRARLANDPGWRTQGRRGHPVHCLRCGGGFRIHGDQMTIPVE